MSRAAVQEILSVLPLVCGPTELAAMRAWLDDHDIGVVAARLGLSHLPKADQHRAFNVLWARVIKRLQRRLRSGGGATALLARALGKSEWPRLGIGVRRQRHQWAEGTAALPRACREGDEVPATGGQAHGANDASDRRCHPAVSRRVGIRALALNAWLVRPPVGDTPVVSN